MKLTQVGFALALAAACAATGCASDSSDPEVDPGDGSDDSVSTEPLAKSAEGTFTLHSKFDLASNLPGRVGTVVNVIIDATDDSNDPVQYIYDRVVDGMADGTVKNALRGAGPLVTGYLNDRLLAIAPDFVTRMLELSTHFGQIAKNFGTVSQLQVVKSGTGYLSTHVTSGVEFKLIDHGSPLELEFPFADYGLGDIRVSNVGVTLEDSGKLTIAEHGIAVPMGQVLRVGVDEMILPLIDDDAQNLGELFRNLIDCHEVGQAVYDALRLGSVGAFEAACNTGLTAGATFIYQKIAEIDGNALELRVTGVAKAIDRNRDGTMDDLQRGAWTGTAAYASTPAPLGAASFVGRSQ